MRSNKFQLLQIQKGILKKIKNEIKELSIHEPKSIRKYFLKYKKASKRNFENSSKEELYESLTKSNIVLIGDYHTFSQSQRTALRILRNLNDNKKIILCLEMFMHEHQNFINLYSENKISEEELLAHIKYYETWGFSFENYKPLIDFAKENNIKILALNTKKNRDFNASNILFNSFIENQDALHLTLFGDMHLAPEHLPKEIEKLNAEIITTVIHQNIENVYWKLANEDLEREIEVVKFSDNEFCIMNSTPWMKLQSYLAWHEYQDSVSLDIDEKEDFYSILNRSVSAITTYFDIENVFTNDYTITTINDLDILIKINTSKEFTSDEKKLLISLIKNNKNIIIPRINNIHISSPGPNVISEFASKYIYRKVTLDKRIYSKDDFYLIMLDNFRGFLGSKLFNHKRKLSTPDDLLLLVKSKKLKKKTEELYKNILYFIKTRKIKNKFKTTIVNGIAEYVGALIANEVNDLILDNKIKKDVLERIFTTQYTEHEAKNICLKFLDIFIKNYKPISKNDLL